MRGAGGATGCAATFEDGADHRCPGRRCALLLAYLFHLRVSVVAAGIVFGLPALYVAWRALLATAKKRARGRRAREWDPVSLGVHQVVADRRCRPQSAFAITSCWPRLERRSGPPGWWCSAASPRPASPVPLPRGSACPLAEGDVDPVIATPRSGHTGRRITMPGCNVRYSATCGRPCGGSGELGRRSADIS
jgi:hypothetical protein